MAQTLQRTKTTPGVNKHQNDNLVQSKGVIERPGLKHILGTLFIYLFINLFKCHNDKKDTVYKNTYKIAWG